MFYRAISVIFLLLGTTLSACQNTANVSVPPATSAPSAVPANNPQTAVRRVVALTSLSADIVYQLDKTKLVGMSGSRLFATDKRFAEIPKVSAGRTQPNLEKIVALRPDLVIGAVGFHESVLKRLEETGIATKTVEVDSWDGLLSLTQALAKAISADPSPLLARYQTFLANLPAPSQSVLVLVSRQPFLAPNKKSWAGDLLDKFKAQNVAAQLQGNAPVAGYVTLSPEKILEARPETVLVVDTGEGLPAQLKSEPFWKQLPATERGRVYTFDYYGLVNPGSIDKIEEACLKLREVLSKR